jgi:hypothetical protein
MRFPQQIPVLALLCSAAAVISLNGCQNAGSTASSAPAASDAKTAAAGADDKDTKDKEDDVSVAISAEDAGKLGVRTAPLQAAAWVPESTGYALVVSHDAIAQAVAELSSAQAAVRQSRATLERIGQLAGGAGALSAETRESAERQAGIDAAALTLAERRLTSVVGEHPNWPQASSEAMLAELASGRTKLLHVIFPAGSTLPEKPASLRLARIGATGEERSWTARAPWPAPADPQVPGRSFFAVLGGSALSEGEHVEAFAPIGAVEHGLLVPSAAIVQSLGQYWCYVEAAPGKYQRVAIDTSRPRADGYVVSDGLSANQKVVVQAAALLLARELNPSTEAE